MIGYVLGVAAIGLLAYEGWRRWRTSSPAATKPPGGQPATSGPSSFEDPPRYLGPDTMRMIKGQRYRMRFLSSHLDPRSLFSSVTTYDAAAALPADWPTDPAARSQFDPATRFAAGVWSRESAVVEKPQFLFQVWPTASAS